MSVFTDLFSRQQNLPKQPIDPKHNWVSVEGDLERIEVPGGWIYRDYIGGHSISLVFVPFPREGGKND